jgi:hypothetical protein
LVTHKPAFASTVIRQPLFIIIYHIAKYPFPAPIYGSLNCFSCLLFITLPSIIIVKLFFLLNENSFAARDSSMCLNLCLVDAAFTGEIETGILNSNADTTDG